MRFGHLMIILFVLFVVLSVIEGNKRYKKETICLNQKGQILRDADGHYWCVVDGQTQLIKSLKEKE